MAIKLLIVEDDKDLQSVLVNFLQGEGFITDIASNGSEALSKIEKLSFDLVLLDLGLPDIQGETVLTKIRENFSDLPVVVLTAKSKPQEIAQGLNLGADDYLAKPFAAEELLARVNARLKTPLTEKILTSGDLTLNTQNMIAKRGDQIINLTKTEFDLLKFLLQNSGKVLSREVILNHVWGYYSGIESRVVDVYLGYLRKKIDEGFPKKLIQNRRGFGYFIDS